jgi:hypothetical protein
MRTSMVAIGLVAVLLLSSCRKPDNANETIAPAVAPVDPDLQVKAGGYQGRHFSGPAYIPRSSSLADGTTVYNVTYQHGVTVLSKEETLRHLLAIQRDGSYVFDSSATQIARLQPGGVLLLSGLALCSVVDIKNTSAGYLIKTEPAKITDAIKDGRLEGTYPVDFSKLQPTEGIADFDVEAARAHWPTKGLDTLATLCPTSGCRSKMAS